MIKISEKTVPKPVLAAVFVVVNFGKGSIAFYSSFLCLSIRLEQFVTADGLVEECTVLISPLLYLSNC